MDTMHSWARIRAVAGLALASLFASASMAQQPPAVGPYTDFKGTIALDVRDSKADWGVLPRFCGHFR